ncbi:hypothetical protein AT864_03432 [Anoxybacillus sp. P3H1B]|jgi:hypothetical protein|uniref:Uncharacterized protein n=2 Tax=Anoxybacteroides rupiense TaxID=311460 RepID=A0ABD5ISP3_9BACL|nr:MULTISPECIES: hypothetical protein [Anoxybacillus]KXG08311.1 hypothetical protein AT864_03432 [Anoxybacillus sp. P3H1B]MBS2772041.1 hypothetical protein [Anoxybacillus rupiensis]MED5050719.1 hypothetical protein [Anoxybacillus rupiensis]QHC02912.1 hypothetical protein GRQ40_02210 [Anoxybacillus sp. PDR2]
MKRPNLFLILLATIAAVSGLCLLINAGVSGRVQAIPIMDMPHRHDLFMGRHYVDHSPPMIRIYENSWAIWILFPLLMKWTMIISGWMLWRTAKSSSGWKWGGLALMGIGITALLPKILLVPFILFAIYMMYHKRQVREEWPTVAPSSGQAIDFLDEWEKTIQKKEE